MNNITLQTRFESHKKTNKQTRYMQILKVLEECGELTSREITEELYKRGYIQYKDVNTTRPRLTELEQMKIVEVTGEKYDNMTNRNVAVYKKSVSDATDQSNK